MKFRRVAWVLLLGLITPWHSRISQALPVGVEIKPVPGFTKNEVTFALTDDDRHLGLTLAGGAIKATEGVFFAPGTKWVTNMGIQAAFETTLPKVGPDKPSVVDVVSIIGNTTHLQHPPGDGQSGIVVPFSFVGVFRGDFEPSPFFFSPQAKPPRRNDTFKLGGEAPHGSHTDKFKLGSDSVFERQGNHITKWQTAIEADHTEARSKDIDPPDVAAPSGLKPIPKSQTTQFNLIEDNPAEFILSLVGLPFVIGQEKETVPKFEIEAKNWKIVLTSIDVANMPSKPGEGLVEDTVKVNGTISHTARPHGERTDGEALEFNTTFSNKSAPTVNGTLLRTSPHFTRKHQDHSDAYTFIGAQPGPPGSLPDLFGWDLTIVGKHKMEGPQGMAGPHTAALIGLGAMALVANVWRRKTRRYDHRERTPRPIAAPRGSGRGLLFRVWRRAAAGEGRRSVLW